MPESDPPVTEEAPLGRCRCHSRKQERRCCGPFHGGRAAPTPVALMRSRYAAYAKGLVDYVLDTTDPEGPHFDADRVRWSTSVGEFCRHTRFDGLEILSAPEPVGDEGFVTFRAVITQRGRDASFVERSRFRRRDGRWLYVEGVPE